MSQIASRTEQLLLASQSVFENCALPNGAILAANPDLSEYPSTAVSYRYVWERDVAFVLMAMHTLRMSNAHDIRHNHVRWLNDRSAGFSRTGLIVKRYDTNGPLDWRYGEEYQPDQAGTLLLALSETQGYPDKDTDATMRLLARGLAFNWQGDRFGTPTQSFLPTQDLWENRLTTPEGDVFTYSIASVACGLSRAIQRFRGQTDEVELWGQARDEMEHILASQQGPHYLRKIYPNPTNDPDNTLDASLNGLIYPFAREDDALKSQRRLTTLAIDRRLCQLPDGVLRYEGDTYDGIVRPGGQEATAGRWPLLTFWHIIALNRIGETDRAHELYDATIEHLDDLYNRGALPDNCIPEQLFPDDRQGKGVLPLAWSHAMFVLATKELKIS